MVYDACVLYPAPLRDLLVRLGRTGLCQVKWTRQILDECFRSIAAQRPELAPEKLRRSRELLEQVIVTFNLKDFPKTVLARYGMEAQHPDDFVRDLIDLDAATVAQVVRAQAATLKNPPRTLSEVLERLSDQGLTVSASMLKETLGI